MLRVSSRRFWRPIEEAVPLRAVIFAVAILPVVFWGHSAMADTAVHGLSRTRACRILISRAIEFRQSRRDLSGRYYCDNEGDTPEYYAFALRYRVTTDELVGSNLLGRYHVKRPSGKVYRVSADSMVEEPLVKGPPFEK
jgi:hypothetical protein